MTAVETVTIARMLAPMRGPITQPCDSGEGCTAAYRTTIEVHGEAEYGFTCATHTLGPVAPH